jgi:hypothetical protein
MQVVTHRLPDGPITIAPLGDIHYGSPGCDVEKLRRHIEWGLERDWYFIGMGDYLDGIRPSSRQALMSAVGDRDEVARILDDAGHRLVLELAEVLKAEGRWLGCVKGDHYQVFSDGQTSDDLLANKLKAPNLGHAGFLELWLGKFKRPVRIWVHHGKVASSSNPAGQILDFTRKQQGFDADVYLMGHAHQLVTLRRDVLFPYTEKGKPGVANREVIYASTGSFLNGYAIGTVNPAGWPHGSYVEEKGLPPLPTGAPIITVKPEIKHGQPMFEMRGSA